MKIVQPLNYTCKVQLMLGCLTNHKQGFFLGAYRDSTEDYSSRRIGKHYAEQEMALKYVFMCCIKENRY
jgi:hypothetical protein